MATKWLIGGLLLASGIAFVAGQQEMSSNTFSPDELDQQNAAQITQHQNNFNDGQELMTVSIALLTGSTLAASILAVTEK